MGFGGPQPPTLLYFKFVFSMVPPCGPPHPPRILCRLVERLFFFLYSLFLDLERNQERTFRDLFIIKLGNIILL
jgi:hypothetical protein